MQYGGKLEYDNKILEIVSIEGKNGWNTDENSFNATNFKFVVDNEKLITEDGDIFIVNFKVKENIETPQTTVIGVNNIAVGTGKEEITVTSSELEIKIEKENIVTKKYVVEDGFISRIVPETTVKNFKQNIETNQSIIFIDKNGKELGEEDIITTGTVIKIGDNLEYTSVVIGDTDGDGKIGVNDLARLKLDYIKFSELTGAYLKAADLDNNGEFGINDIAQTKLVIVGLMVIE